MKQRALSALWAFRLWLGVILLHMGWKLCVILLHMGSKLIGVHVSPGIIMLSNGKKITL